MGRALHLHTTERFVCTTLEFFNADAKTRENFVFNREACCILAHYRAFCLHNTQVF